MEMDAHQHAQCNPNGFAKEDHLHPNQLATFMITSQWLLNGWRG